MINHMIDLSAMSSEHCSVNLIKFDKIGMGVSLIHYDLITH